MCRGLPSDLYFLNISYVFFFVPVLLLGLLPEFFVPELFVAVVVVFFGGAVRIFFTFKAFSFVGSIFNTSSDLRKAAGC